MCDIVFYSAKSCGGAVNRTSDYEEAAVKTCYEKFRKIHKKTLVPETL